jgi:hypothetical protein
MTDKALSGALRQNYSFVRLNGGRDSFGRLQSNYRMEHNVIVGVIPWPVAIITAIWFAVMAVKARKNAALWAIGGGALGLIVTTIILGLGQSMFIPMSDAEIIPFRIKMSLLAIVVVAGMGWLFAGSLHPHVFTPWRRRAEPVIEPAPVDPATKAATPPPRA